MFAEIDCTKWPVVVISYNQVKGSKFKDLFEDFKLEFMKIITKANNNGEKCILIYNLNKIQHFNVRFNTNCLSKFIQAVKKTRQFSININGNDRSVTFFGVCYKGFFPFKISNNTA